MEKKPRKLNDSQRQMMTDFLDNHKEAEPQQLIEALKSINSGVIAIIMTIIVLEIKAPEAHYSYSIFVHEISIFIITFLLIANFWYDLHQIFAYFITKPSKIDVIVNFLFLAAMSLIPITTKWVMDKPTTFAVINYGMVFFLANLFKYILEIVGMNETFPHFNLTNDKTIWRALMHAGALLLLNLALIIISCFNVTLGIILYLLFPIITFIWPYRHVHHLQ